MALRDDQWEKIEPLLSGRASDCGVTGKGNRLFIEAVLWVCRTGAPWRDSRGSWQLAYSVYALQSLVKKGAGKEYLALYRKMLILSI